MAEGVEMKIVQIAACSTENVSGTQCNWLLFALFDDGSLRVLTSAHDWRIIDLPEDPKP